MTRLPSRFPARRPRRGVAVLLVLLLVSMTLGLTYAAIRSQSTLLAVQRNSGRRQSARQAAVTGMTMALKKMQTSAWAGVDTQLSGSLGDGARWEVTYTTGDPRLTAASPDYSELPLRVTLLATGFVTDAVNTQCVSTWQVRAVVRLVPRQLSSETPEWGEIRTHSLYQWSPGEAKINVPCRIEGTARFQSDVNLAEDIQWSDTVRSRFMTDLDAMRSAGMSDWRPFSGKVELPFNGQPALTLPLLGAMGVSTMSVTGKTVTRLTAPTISTYRLYAGGKAYNVQALGKSLQGVSLGPNPTTNPAGIFTMIGNVEVHDDVQIIGTVIIGKDGDADLHVWGKRVHLGAVSLPALDSDTAVPVQLPAVIAEDDIQAFDGADLTIDGFLSCIGDFVYEAGGQAAMQVTIHGGVVARNIKFNPRWEWQCSNGSWSSMYNGFKAQEPWPGGNHYFPDWLNHSSGVKPPPKLLIAPPTSAVRYHWQFASEPIYVPAAGDGGLRWELLDWTERL